MITLRTDGACTPNGEYSGCGGWAYKVTSPNAEFENAGGECNTTNNRMEIEAVLQGLKQIFETKHFYKDKVINVFSDSEYVVNTVNGEYSIKMNQGKWKELLSIKTLLEKKGFKVILNWERGKTSQENKYIDKMAKKAKDNMKKIMDFRDSYDEVLNNYYSI